MPRFATRAVQPDREVGKEQGIGICIPIRDETRLTAFGRPVVTIAEDMLFGAQSIKDAATEFPDPEAVSFHICLTTTLAPELTKHFMEPFNELSSNMRVTMIEDLPQNQGSEWWR
ncbi:hypothetical protein [uncultured Tateyamaria sp.]|uniref:hypothetical protein n=1 Tax=uncultured Tateyamaria sp. TaxID=455651 RepID=UPI00262B3C46|nr:hypothetical protein [uncultured Tateyamaria sp.]